MLVALDTETALITEFEKVPLLTCVSYAGEDGSKGLLRWCDAKQQVAHNLTHDTIVGANVAYDMAQFCRQWPDLIPLVWQAYADDRVRDIQVEQKLIDIAEGRGTKHAYNLSVLAKGYLDVDMDKTTYRLGYGALRNVPIEQWPEGARQYSIYDAETTLRIAQLVEPHAGPDRFRQARHAWWTSLMGIWGIRTDPQRVAALKQKLIIARDQAFSLLIDAGLVRKQGGKYVQDTKKTRARMADVCQRNGLPLLFTEPSERYPEGQIKIAEEQLVDSNDPVLMAMADYGSIRKQLSTDIPNLERGEIHTRYDSLKDTGRVGSGGEDRTSPTGTAFNLTNLPRSGGIRECFVPRDGLVFYDSDYDGLEAHTGAQACIWLVGESVLAGILNRGEDWHCHTAAPFFNISYEECVQRKRDGDKEVKDVRQFAKIVNYGCGGGMGKDTLYGHTQKELKKEGHRELAARVTKDITDRLWEIWRTNDPAWQKYFLRNGAMTRDGTYTAELLVSKRLRTVSGNRAYTELNNTYFQSLGADAAKAAGWQILREQYDPSQSSILFGSRNVIFGHDSFTGECDPEGGHEIAMRIKTIMEGVSDVWVPDCPLTTTPCLAICMSKDATALYDSNGRLIPWSPK